MVLWSHVDNAPANVVDPRKFPWVIYVSVGGPCVMPQAAAGAA